MCEYIDGAVAEEGEWRVGFSAECAIDDDLLLLLRDTSKGSETLLEFNELCKGRETVVAWSARRRYYLPRTVKTRIVSSPSSSILYLLDI